MTALRERMTDDMRIRNFSPNTIDGYIRAVAQFAKHYMQTARQFGGVASGCHFLS